MEEVYEIVENTFVKHGNDRYKPVPSETNLSRPDYLKTMINYGQANIDLGYTFEILSGSTISLKLEGIDYQFQTNSFLASGYPNAIDERIFIEQSFETKVWHKVTSLLNENREESALVYLYETLNDELENITNCDSFLKISIGMQMTSDIIVHILNALSPIKSTLRNWEEFKVYSTELLESEVGKKTAKTLLNAIV